MCVAVVLLFFVQLRYRQHPAAVTAALPLLLFSPPKSCCCFFNAYITVLVAFLALSSLLPLDLVLFPDTERERVGGSEKIEISPEKKRQHPIINSSNFYSF